MLCLLSGFIPVWPDHESGMSSLISAMNSGNVQIVPGSESTVCLLVPPLEVLQDLTVFFLTHTMDEELFNIECISIASDTLAY